MALCFSTLSITGFNPNEAVHIRFKSQSDGTVMTHDGVSDGNGVITITQPQDRVFFIANVTYRMTANGYDMCYLLKFEHVLNVAGTNETVVEC